MKVHFETFDTFLILSTGHFTRHDLDLADKVRHINKTFFFVRTKVDIDCVAQKRKKAFKEEVMLQEMRTNCAKNLQGNEEVFLISNLYPTKWDFLRLTHAILDALPCRQKECLAFSLTSLSADILKRKAGVLQGTVDSSTYGQQ